MIYDDYSFIQTAKTFYDNGDCNSLEEFEADISRIVFIGNHFNRFDRHGTTNIPLLMNHLLQLCMRGVVVQVGGTQYARKQ